MFLKSSVPSFDRKSFSWMCFEKGRPFFFSKGSMGGGGGVSWINIPPPPWEFLLLWCGPSSAFFLEEEFEPTKLPVGRGTWNKICLILS